MSLFRWIVVSLLALNLGAAEPPQGTLLLQWSMIIRGGVSLGAYESGYNWAMIRMLSLLREREEFPPQRLRSVAGASAGSINALLSTLYWCQKPEIREKNEVENNLFFDTWVDLGIEDLLVLPNDTENRSTIFSRRVLRKKADAIMKHMARPLYRKGCEVSLGVAITKAHPILEEFEGIPIRRQAFSVPLKIREKNGAMVAQNAQAEALIGLHYMHIPGIERDRRKLTDLLFASSAFPGAFPPVELSYEYEGKKGKGYFIDGGIYNNTPLDLAIALDNRSRYFHFLDPDHLRRKEKAAYRQATKEQPPVGFLKSNFYPLANAADIYQQIFLYQAIDRYFRGHPERHLRLSSRWHPLTAGFFSHFGAFFDRNFRLYDYHVGVYDAIWVLASTLRRTPYYAKVKQREMMDRLAKVLELERSREARTAYRFFRATEFGEKRPPRKNRYAAIYYAFRPGVGPQERYSAENFEYFLRHLDLRYLPHSPKSFLAQATKDPRHWYKRPLRYIINRITLLEDYYAELHPDWRPIADLLNVVAWGGSSLVRRKEGWEVQSIHAPREKRHATMRGLLKLLPKEIAVDTVNGGASFAYEASYYADIGWIDGFEFRGSYNFQDRKDGGDFLHLDADLFHEYNDALSYGFGLSGFGNVERRFWDRESAYGLNAYLDFMEIFRATYVWRHGENVNNHSLYFGVENLPSLIYWLER